MSFLKKLPNSRKYPHGLEWKILRKIPWAFLYSFLIIAIFVGVAHLLPPEGTPSEIHKHLQMVNILGIALWITAWTGIFTVGFGAFVVYLMKGPAYVADPIELSDSENPKV